MPRMTMALPPHMDVVLTQLAKEEQITKALVVRRALALYARLRRAEHDEGYMLALCQRDGAVVREILLDL